MKRFTVACLLLALSGWLFSYPTYYKEQYWKLFHTHYIQYPDDTIENIYWLEQAKKAPFCNPLYALAKIENEKQWERYRSLLDMHINLNLIQQHLILGSKYDKQVAYFYNAPWKDENLESLKIAETCYLTALRYWDETVELARRAEALRWTYLDASYWIDEAWRITNGELDYADIIADELARLAKVRADFEAMGYSY
jgi:hypothetical protein